MYNKAHPGRKVNDMKTEVTHKLMTQNGRQLSFIRSEKDKYTVLRVNSFMTGIQLENEIKRQGIKCVLIFLGGYGWYLQIPKKDWPNIKGIV